jgi:hypothetical protein
VIAEDADDEVGIQLLCLKQYEKKRFGAMLNSSMKIMCILATFSTCERLLWSSMKNRLKVMIISLAMMQLHLMLRQLAHV